MPPFIFISSQTDGAYDMSERSNAFERLSKSVEQYSEYWVG